MAPHPLDNPILSSLETSHARFARGDGPARRFDPEVSPLAGFRGPIDAGLRALLPPTPSGEACALFLDAPPEPGPEWTKTLELPLLQMVHEGPVPEETGRALVELGPEDAREMLELATLTKPGPFSLRTRELGGYFGVREGGRLAAMSGERLRLPGYTEISAVCTHPEHLGQGHAAALMTRVLRGIRARGDAAFLHVLPSNARAIAVYERLGFKKRRLFTYVSLRRA